jgi:hypothetical protein
MDLVELVEGYSPSTPLSPPTYKGEKKGGGDGCFILTDVQRLAGYLTESYNIRCSIHKSNGNHRIYILAKSVQTVRDLVLPYMHDSMLYKLGI